MSWVRPPHWPLFYSSLPVECFDPVAHRQPVVTSLVALVSLLHVPSNARIHEKRLAPGEARTPDLRISLSILTYKYDALTDCATGANMKGYSFPPLHLLHLVLDARK